MTWLDACWTGFVGSDTVGGERTWQSAELGAMVQMSAPGGDEAVCGGDVGGEVGEGRTTAQPGNDGLTMQTATVGNTAEQPAALGVATHTVNDGSTLAHPATAGSETQAFRDGTTAALTREFT